MRRRRPWPEWVLIAVLLFIALDHLVREHLFPAHLLPILQRATKDTVRIGHVRLGFPLQLVLSDVHLTHTNPGTAVSSRQIVIIPQWLSWRKKTFWVGTLKIIEPRIGFRRTSDGRLTWPIELPASGSSSADPSRASASPPVATAVPGDSPWRVLIRAVQVTDGTLEFVDEKTPQPFRGVLSELSFAAGPMAWPPRVGQFSLAIQGRLIGYQQHGAAVYCSGWMDVEAKSLDCSCQLEPLRLAAFEPYYQGPVQVRVYDATLRATGRFVAKANALDGRAQLEINNLSEADLSFLGKTIADIKKITGGPERMLTGEIQLSGPLDRPSEWRFQLAPGNDVVQRLVQPLVDRGVEIIRIKVGQQTIKVGLSPASEAVMSSIGEASKSVQENLKILTPASSAEQPPLIEPPGVPPTPGEAPAQAPPGSSASGQPDSATAGP